MSWGNRLLIVFIAFAGMIFYLVYRCINTQVDLVTPKYYEEELKYEDHIDAVNNTAKIGDVNVQQNVSDVTVTLPKEMQGLKVTGEAWFYNKTNANNDKHVTFETNNCVTAFEKDKLPKGNFLLKLSWKTGSENYYIEKSITL